MKTIKLVIADDHELFRNGLKELLKRHEDIEVVQCVSDGEELIKFVKTHPDIDIVLLDITMPNMDGFEALNKLKSVNTNVKPIIISMHDDGNYIAKCAKMGAFSYLLKNTDQEELVKVVRIVSEDKKYFSPNISEKMIDYMSENTVSEDILSKKEAEVLLLISKGNTTKEIAAELYVSSRTIETHRANILKKLNVKNTAELIIKAVKMKLIS
ncbi:response regulator [Seonamhaeicola aphaedonensis]|uniref:LuxR family two component transcriptional regulator n=1 Tax=Seonamhaeicola aphaedonensis TaxID=1461338 RepID=A0A3D9HHN6_9FLAO|nr:response regulator transcription factor [Seonamhaeicola aphaedonensis]RED48980.1 LuxR family two component transcriptional regulator [Seonamhaeicola aphaedonensis]